MKKKIFSVTLIFMGIQEILQYFLILRLVTFIRTDDSSLYLNGECEGVMSHFWAKFESEEKRIFIRMRKFSRGSRSPKINEQENGIFLASYWSIFTDFFEIFSEKFREKNPKKVCQCSAGQIVGLDWPERNVHELLFIEDWEYLEVIL